MCYICKAAGPCSNGLKRRCRCKASRTKPCSVVYLAAAGCDDDDGRPDAGHDDDEFVVILPVWRGMHIIIQSTVAGYAFACCCRPPNVLIAVDIATLAACRICLHHPVLMGNSPHLTCIDTFLSTDTTASYTTVGLVKRTCEQESHLRRQWFCEDTCEFPNNLSTIDHRR